MILQACTAWQQVCRRARSVAAGCTLTDHSMQRRSDDMTMRRAFDTFAEECSLRIHELLAQSREASVATPQQVATISERQPASKAHEVPDTLGADPLASIVAPGILRRRSSGVQAMSGAALLHDSMRVLAAATSSTRVRRTCSEGGLGISSGRL
jgi:hypothetical protein